ncbi:MAG: UPF0158 family protein [Treponema phagedenis]|uniref:GNAT family N-acetyltransferase n=1 Tax=Treponema phagedenis TaxID=162 RepID=A0AAE6M8A4_TREPH|nr:GNAT family N-acetyltransferase [Treponema phagedenis]QEJ97322.1 GNAT family N-acetyltransferase [Treponema phagedenis]
MIISNGMDIFLSPETIGELIFAMENQHDRYLFDIQTGKCINQTDAITAIENEPENRFYAIPDWNSSCGFRVMERFTAEIRNPVLREQLRDIFSQRKGVFKNFKEALKDFPEIEHRWYKFKEAEMRAVIYTWFNDLREQHNLEPLCFEEEETGDLIREDFVFETVPLKTLSSSFLIDFLRDSSAMPLNHENQDAFSLFEYSLLQELCIEEIALKDTENSTVILIKNDEEVIGCCLLLPSKGQSLEIPVFRILPEYRGFGLGKELLHKAISFADDTMFRFLQLTDRWLPSYFYTTMESAGFRQLGLIFSKKCTYE